MHHATHEGRVHHATHEGRVHQGKLSQKTGPVLGEVVVVAHDEEPVDVRGLEISHTPVAIHHVEDLGHKGCANTTNNTTSTKKMGET